MKRNLIYLSVVTASVFASEALRAQTASQNYVRTRMPRVALQPSQVDGAASNKTQVQTMVQYVDGLGRPSQAVQQQGSPAGNDVVQPVVYDEQGREAVKYLPYTQTQSGVPAAYRSDAFTVQPTFYHPPAQVGYSNDDAPFALTVFEASPLNRVSEQGAPGSSWQPVNGSQSGHTVKIFYLSNDASSLTSGSGYWAKQYGVSIDATTGNRTLTDEGAYAQNQLYLTVTTNENWVSGKLGTTEEYKDIEGHVVLKRTFNYNKATNANETLSTYYVYDDLGNLAFVLPPLANADNAQPSQTTLDNLCYQYRYDERGRMAQKHLPGKDWEYTVYNQLDQPVMTQDGNQRQSNQWSVTKYDALSRVIMNGLWNDPNSSPQSLSTLQNNIYAGQQYDARDYSGNSSSGYTIGSYPSLSIPLTVNYYDDYSVIPGLPSAYTAPSSASSKTRGLMTASKTSVLNDIGTNAFAILWQAHYYDEEARPVAVYNQHYLGGLAALSTNNFDLISNSYDFTGQLLSSVRQHYKNNTANNTASPQLTVNNTYSYDHMGRKLQTFEQITQAGAAAGANVLLSQSTYNELGQLWQKQLHSSNYVSGAPFDLVLGSADAVSSGNRVFSATHSITMGPGFSVAASASASFSIASFLQTINYAYNERGWLTQINNPDVAPTPTSLFSERLNYNLPQNGAAAQYNGNIAEQVYNASISGRQQVNYAYDNLNRLTDGTASTGFSETGISYDLNGNIGSLTRSGPSSAVLSYAYNGNQLSTVTNNANAFRNYAYDQNANGTSDGMGNTIGYNLLNLPQTIPGKNITFTYNATGQKLRKVSGSIGTDYIGGIQYENGALQFVQTEEGRAINSGGNYVYEYTLTDHLGNNRVTIDQNNGKVGEDDYYPFGLNVHRQQNAGNKYLYNKKELQDDLNNQYDYGARFYDPAIARWTSTDPLAELGRRHSPYEYGMNNPIRMVDPDGMWAHLMNPATAGADWYGDNGSHTQDDEQKDAQKKEETNVGADGLTSQQWIDASRPEENQNVESDYPKGNKDEQQLGYHPAPKNGLPAFPEAGKGSYNKQSKRWRWKLQDGSILEWDKRHGKVEKFDKTGKKHQGEFDPETGKKTKEPEDDRSTPKFSSEEPDSPIIINRAPSNNEGVSRVVKTGTAVGSGLTILLIILLSPIGL